jgi:beta-glucanase (GH16 family)
MKSKPLLVFRKSRRISTVAIAAVVIGCLGMATLFVSHAATPAKGTEAETGSTSGPVGVVSDSTASSGKAVKFAPSSMGLKLVWDDEFNGSSVDTAKWNVRTGSNGYDEVYNLPANVTESGGNLIITGKRQTYNSEPYTSGYLDTIGKEGWRYGKFEMRAKLPIAKDVSRGIWPAWWLRANDGNTGEIDIMEAWGDPGTKTGTSEDPYDRVLGTAFANTNDPSQGKSSGWSGTTGSLDVSQWHTYSVVWDATGVTWYVDDVAYRSATSAQYPWLATSFPTTVNLRLNLQISNNYYGLADSTTVLPVQYVVDYVRIYQ